MNSSYHDSQTLLEQQRQRLERKLHQQDGQIIQQSSRFRRFVEHFGQTLGSWLKRGHEIKISLIVQDNTEVWKVYDPLDHSTHYFTQENDVRVYLERRYYL